jgi:hypothetical protein
MGAQRCRLAGVADLPAGSLANVVIHRRWQRRPGAWRMFWIGWLLVTLGAGSTFIPQWRAGTVIPSSAREQAADVARVRRMAALGGALSFLGAGF